MKPIIETFIADLRVMVDIHSICFANQNDLFKKKTVGLFIRMDDIRGIDAANILEDVFRKFDLKIADYYKPMTVLDAWDYLTEPNKLQKFLQAYDDYNDKNDIDNLIEEVGIYSRAVLYYFSHIDALAA